MSLSKLFFKLMMIAEEVDHIRSLEGAINEILRLIKVAKELERRASNVTTNTHPTPPPAAV